MSYPEPEAGQASGGLGRDGVDRIIYGCEYNRSAQCDAGFVAEPFSFYSDPAGPVGHMPGPTMFAAAGIFNPAYDTPLFAQTADHLAGPSSRCYARESGHVPRFMDNAALSNDRQCPGWLDPRGNPVEQHCGNPPPPSVSHDGVGLASSLFMHRRDRPSPSYGQTANPCDRTAGIRTCFDDNATMFEEPRSMRMDGSFTGPYQRSQEAFLRDRSGPVPVSVRPPGSDDDVIVIEDDDEDDTEKDDRDECRRQQSQEQGSALGTDDDGDEKEPRRSDGGDDNDARMAMNRQGDHAPTEETDEDATTIHGEDDVDGQEDDVEEAKNHDHDSDVVWTQDVNYAPPPSSRTCPMHDKKDEGLSMGRTPRSTSDAADECKHSAFRATGHTSTAAFYNRRPRQSRRMENEQQDDDRWGRVASWWRNNNRSTPSVPVNGEKAGPHQSRKHPTSRVPRQQNQRSATKRQRSQHETPEEKVIIVDDSDDNDDDDGSGRGCLNDDSTDAVKRLRASMYNEEIEAKKRERLRSTIRAKMDLKLRRCPKNIQAIFRALDIRIVTNNTTSKLDTVSYKKLLLKYHPDKVAQQQRQRGVHSMREIVEAEEIFKLLSAMR